jgi:hypothetical protein
MYVLPLEIRDTNFKRGGRVRAPSPHHILVLVSSQDMDI